MKKSLLIIFLIVTFCIKLLATVTDSIPYFKSKGITQTVQKKSTNLYAEYNLLIQETDPKTETNIIVKAHYFQNKRTGKLPLLIIVPPINGVSRRERSVTKHFIKEGYNTLIIEPVKNISDGSIPIAEFESNLLSFVGAVRSCIDVMTDKAEIDTNNIFVWASSMGAIYTSIVIGIDNRINAGIFILGGGLIPDIVTETKQKHIANYRKERMLKENLKDEESFRLKMKENMKIDPTHFAKKRKASDIFFVMATKDKSVPTKCQQALYESFGSPKTFKKNRSGHAMTLMKSHFLNLKSYSDFTNGRLKKN